MARAICAWKPDPTEAELAVFGLTRQEATAPPIEVWPDSMPAVNTFIAMSTQWRVGKAGATGLDYGVLPGVLRMTSVPRQKWPEVFESIRVMEYAALIFMRQRNHG